MGATPNRPRPKPTFICHIQIFGSLKANLTLKIKVKVTYFQNHLRHLDDQ